jgi:hypothetical protein
MFIVFVFCSCMDLMKKLPVVSAIILFILINTSYFWEGKLDDWAFPAYMLLFIVYLLLAFFLLTQLPAAIKEKFRNKQRVITIILLAIVLISAFIRPTGFINFENFIGNDLLVARREGAANCTTTLKLKDNNKFIEKGICFGMTEVKGFYELKGDTIWFKNVELSRNESSYYEYAIIKHSKYQNEKIIGDLIRYKNHNDTSGHVLFITKNTLNQ